MSTLEKFIAQQKSMQAAQRPVDWSKRLDKWLQELDALFTVTRGLLVAAGLRDSDILVREYDINEEKLGTYKAPGLDIALPAGVVHMVPRASVIIGGYGRVDVTGPNRTNSVKLIADDADEQRPDDDETPSYERDWTWRVYPGPGARNSYPFDEEGLSKLLEAVSN